MICRCSGGLHPVERVQMAGYVDLRRQREAPQVFGEHANLTKTTSQQGCWWLAGDLHLCEYKAVLDSHTGKCTPMLYAHKSMVRLRSVEIGG